MEIIIPNALLTGVLAALIIIRWRASKSIIEPGIVFSINLIILYPVRAMVLYVFGHESGPSYIEILSPENIEKTSWMALIGGIGYTVGYLFVARKKYIPILKDGGNKMNLENSISTIYVLFILSLVGIVYKIATNDYMSYLLAKDKNAGLAHIGTLLTGLQWPAFIGAWILWFQGVRKKEFLVLFSIIIAVVVPYQFLQGSKTFLTLLLVSIIVSNYWVTAKLPKVSVLIGVFLVVFFVFPFVHNFRENINLKYGEIPSLSKINLGEIFAEPEEERYVNEARPKGLMGVSSRYAGIDELYNLQEIVPRIIDYRYALDYTAFFVNLVPRAVWPNKPIYSRGADYGDALNTLAAITPFPFGEAYWDFGIIGLVIMTPIWGICLAGLVRGYNYFYKKKGNSELILFFFLSQLSWISGGESSMPMILAGLPQQIAILWFVSVLVREVGRLRRGHSHNKNTRSI